MPSINIDGTNYDLDNMSQAAKGQLASLQFVERELQRLGSEAAVYQTAKVAYIKALKEALVPPDMLTAPGGDTLRLG
ncbi:MAG: hypothetical protein CFE43_11725 [Burkholderiales bacterium PBB3]|nr:MAG: hypothetical protein CFE43_11725 [Burkholderiales bacterium PBB3]